jgi:phosphatidate cytidylyltransferase
VIAPILWVTLPGFVLGACGMALANRRASAPVARARWLKIGVFFLIVHGVLAVTAAGHPWIEVLVLFVLLAGGVELSWAWRNIAPPRPAWLWPAYLLLASLVAVNSWRLPAEGFIFLFLATATCDGFSQVVGQWLGRRPLAPRISPGKTVAGLGGGLVAVSIVAMLMRDLVHTGPAVAGALGIVAGMTGLLGDLGASWIKRSAGIKDYSRALPGQGGFLDRFDSLLGALALTGPILLAIG